MIKMAKIKRVDMKRMVKPMLTQALLTMFQSKVCEHKHMKLELKAYQHSGLSAKLEHYNFGVMVNIYQNGEVSYKRHVTNIYSDRIVIIEPDEYYNDIEVYNKIKDFIQEIKQDLKYNM